MRLFVALRPLEPVLLHLDLALRTVAVRVDTGDRSSPVRWLSDAVGRAGADLVARSDDRVGSRPHLTVGRVDPSIRRLRSRWTRQAQPEDPADALVRALAVYAGPSWLVEDVHLLASQPGAGRGGGPLHTTIRTHRLAGA
ncbi:MAG: hypothetical protein HHJ14_02660 [Cellulomonas sp.]|nr:hypothetical protein [Cellulomonas sp.]